jgi:ketosteroid isomerase-like protein
MNGILDGRFINQDKGDQMAHPNEDLVRESFAAYGRGDLDAARKYQTDDIRYHQPGRNPTAGDYEGQEQVIGVMARFGELTGGTLSIELHDVLANDQHAVAMMTMRGERAGKQLNENVVIVFHLRDGKIAEVWAHPTDQYANDEFWS